MKRATLTAIVDQALLSALNLGIALLLIRFADKTEYGTYAQIINLQALFSPLHASLFVSAFLTMSARLEGERLQLYRAGMARVELCVTLASCAVVALLTHALEGVLHVDLGWHVAIAAAAALLTLWWREFVRQIHFSNLNYTGALRVAGTYVALTAVAVVAIMRMTSLSATGVLAAMAVASGAVTLHTVISTIRSAAPAWGTIRDDLSASWRIARWELLGSFVSWLSSQSYLYFASLQGGVGMVAEVAAARLFASPLALLWIAQANVVRPQSAKHFASGALDEAARLSQRSLFAVLAISSLYGILLYVGLSSFGEFLSNKGFSQTSPLALAWVCYFALTGISTVASGVLRSSLEFRSVFNLQLIACCVSVALLSAGAMTRSAWATVIPLIAAELVFGALLCLKVKKQLNPARRVHAMLGLRSGEV